MPETAEQASHAEMAEGRLSYALDLVKQSRGADTYIPIALAEAKVHSNLAIAEELRHIREDGLSVTTLDGGTLV